MTWLFAINCIIAVFCAMMCAYNLGKVHAYGRALELLEKLRRREVPRG